MHLGETSQSLSRSYKPKAVAVATETHPCVVLYKATGITARNVREE